MPWFSNETKCFEKLTKFLVRLDTVDPWYCSGHLPTFFQILPHKNLIYKYQKYLRVYYFVIQIPKKETVC